jgi:GTP-binding protein Era
VSALTGDGVDRLERVLLEQMPDSEPVYPDDYLTDQPERALAAEIVREKVLRHTRDELPFSTAVAVDQFDESSRDTLLRIYCTIFVEQESQKPIVVGRGGDMIKRIGTEARHDLERFFDTKVFLDLRVKVNPDWRNNERTLDELGVPKSKAKKRR